MATSAPPISVQIAILGKNKGQMGRKEKESS